MSRWRSCSRAHPFQFFPDFACVFVLPQEANKQRLLLGKPPFILAYFASIHLSSS
jgi:hypothetical protein